MKAVLVIDMPSDMQIEETKALYITLFNGMIVREYTLDCPLRPMPEPKFAKAKHDDVYWGECIGWNKCIEELEK